ncbi:alkaline phosphatase family protein, partial [Novosphingobium sp.]|uniref:alkaline phosphatase family protein n=1 Tax=Novosphingobium sp. TaxID=1874826 RepID=UPI00263354CE
MRALSRLSLAASLAVLAAHAMAEPRPPEGRPGLVVVISVDQFSANLFAEYRRHVTGGLLRAQQGVVFPLAYQGHATTETCPGHSTILTGRYPAHTGIVANDWIADRAGHANQLVYCVEDESRPGTDATHYVVSADHLRGPTLGDLLKQASPASRVVSVAGKDRAAVLLGGHSADQTWWWNGSRFASYPGRAEPVAVAEANRHISTALAVADNGIVPDALCRDHGGAIPLGNRVVGDGRFVRGAGDTRAFRASPALDGATLDLVGRLIDELQLGRRSATDLLAIGLSATDYVGHTYGAGGQEMCLNILALDAALERLFEKLDRAGLSYVTVLTADHGGTDVPERSRDRAIPAADRIPAALSAEAVGLRVGRSLGLARPVLFGGPTANYWLDRSLRSPQRARALELVRAELARMPEVETVFTRAEILRQPFPTGAPDTWSVLARVRASYDPERGGDLYVVPRPLITPLADATGAYAAMH